MHYSNCCTDTAAFHYKPLSHALIAALTLIALTLTLIAFYAPSRMHGSPESLLHRSYRMH